MKGIEAIGGCQEGQRPVDRRGMDWVAVACVSDIGEVIAGCGAVA